MVFAVDIGNTNIVLGLWEGERLRFVSRLETDKLKTADSYAVGLKSIFELYGVDVAAVEGSIISCVVPQLSKPMSVAVERLTGKKPMVVGPGIRTGLNIRIDDPAQLGSDMVADAVAALERYTPPIVIFDMGTATSISVLNEDGTFLGGAILAGVRVSMDALSALAAQLPQIELAVPPDVIGTNTVSCMQSGAIYGTAAMVDGMVSRIETQLGRRVSVVVTGGNSGVVAAQCKTPVTHDADLLLRGLLSIYRRNAVKAGGKI